MGQEYFFAINGQQRGPFPIERLTAEGMTPDSLVWCEGMGAWQTARTVPALFGVVAGSTAASVPVAYPAPAMYQTYQTYPAGYAIPADVSTKKILAGVMALVMGAWGIHRFILGDPMGGILRIVITFATCGLGSIMWLIEGIIYLTKTDEEFYRIYMVQKKSWF
jgi:TM2 domain-containing membrane protein YozV